MREVRLASADFKEGLFLLFDLRRAFRARSVFSESERRQRKEISNEYRSGSNSNNFSGHTGCVRRFDHLRRPPGEVEKQIAALDVVCRPPDRACGGADRDGVSQPLETMSAVCAHCAQRRAVMFVLRIRAHE
jgi:hypothetical protein